MLAIALAMTTVPAAAGQQGAVVVEEPFKLAVVPLGAGAPGDHDGHGGYR